VNGSKPCGLGLAEHALCDIKKYGGRKAARKGRTPCATWQADGPAAGLSAALAANPLTRPDQGDPDASAQARFAAAWQVLCTAVKGLRRPTPEQRAVNGYVQPPGLI
jgi:hypothetical protein